MFISDMFSSWKYQSVRSSISEDAEGASDSRWTRRHLESEKCPDSSHKSPKLRLVAPWIASTVFFAILAAYFGSQSVKSSTRRPLASFRTDFQAAIESIEYEERVFTGALDYDPVAGKAYRKINPMQPQYFGQGPEIDAAWDELLKDEFPIMTESEAAPFTPQLKPLPNDGEYHFELDVFHSLHCLNAVRMRLNDYYNSTRQPSTDREGWERIHMDHCLDQLRQSIQCHGDLSPVPLYWWQGFNTALGVGHTHTCRKWEPIRKWVDRRNEVKRSSSER